MCSKKDLTIYFCCAMHMHTMIFLHADPGFGVASAKIKKLWLFSPNLSNFYETNIAYFSFTYLMKVKLLIHYNLCSRYISKLLIG